MAAEIQIEISRPELERLVSGTLRDAIHSHGPITKEWIGSASKRVTSQLKARAKELQSV